MNLFSGARILAYIISCASIHYVMWLLKGLREDNLIGNGYFGVDVLLDPDSNQGAW